ncbi:MAG: hypothetical protein KF829_01720 [Ferruginibacter sp.]|nr:hypothetical protein [Ferruginibacter sp.]
MKKKGTLLALISAALAATAIYQIVKGFKSAKRANHVANEGYETAHDILFPKKETPKHKVHLGPVLPTEV